MTYPVDGAVQFIDSEGNPLPEPHRPQVSDRAKVQLGDRMWICRVAKVGPIDDIAEWPWSNPDHTMQAELVPEELADPLPW